MDSKLCNERCKHFNEKLNDHEKRLDGLEKTYAIMEKMDYRMGKVEDAVGQINKKLDRKSEEKGKKWDKFIDYLFYAVLAALLGYISMQLNLK